MIRRRDATGRSDGFALIVVLWYLVLIAAISTYLLANARSETALARNMRAAATAEALADAAVAEAVFNQSASPPSVRWKPNGEPHLIVLPHGEATLRLYDETQKINPNHASPALMAALFEAVGVERVLARRLGASIEDWVDSDIEPRTLGAERTQYIDAGRSYSPPNAAIESIDELQLVFGMTPELLARVRPYLTIHTESGQPGGDEAPLIVRRALALAARTAAVDIRDDENPASATASPAADAPGAPGSIAAAASVNDDEIVRLEITARSSDGGVFVRSAVVKLDSESPKGYVVLDWRRGNLSD